MTDENTPVTSLSTETGATAEGAAPARRTRARRVATSGTTTPRSRTAPAETAAPADGTPVLAPSISTDTPPVASAPDQDAPAAAPRSRSRRATGGGTARSARAAGGDDAAPAQPVAQPAAADAAPAADASATDTAPPARARRSRRATSAGAAPVVPDEQPAAPAAEAPAADAAPARTSRRRGGRAASSDVAPSAEAPAAGTTPDASSTAGSAMIDVLAELGIQRSAPPAPVETDSPRMAATTLLFQAPDPSTRPRRRRAQAPAGPPRHEDEVATPTQPEEETPDAEALTLDDEAATQATDVVDEDTELDDAAEAAEETQRRRRRRGGRGRRSRSGATDRPDDTENPDSGPAARDGVVGDDADEDADEVAEGDEAEDTEESGSSTSRRRRRRRRGARGDGPDDAVATVSPTRTRTRTPRVPSDEVTALKGSTRLEAKRQRRREGRDAGRRRTIVTESEFLARRESVERSMVVREANDRVQIAVLEDGVLVEHFVSRSAQNGQSSMAGNVYLGRVQNVLPSMEAAFVDVGKGRNAVLYAGEVNWDAAGLEGQPRRIEQALKSGDSVLVQVTKDPIGHKGARLTSQITLAGRYLVYVPSGGMTGISRKLPENERARLKKLLKEIVPDAAGVIVRTAAEGASEDELRRDVQRLQDQWAVIEKKAKSASAPALLQGEPDLAIRVVRDIFNDDFSSLVVQGDGVWSMISEYVGAMAPDLAEKVSRWTGTGDVFAAHRVDEQLAKGMDRKVWLPSGGSLVIDRTEAMTVVDVNTGKFTGSGGTLEETVTRNNLEAAEEIVRQLRLRDIGGIIVIDFIDMVLESNRDLVLRRLVECLGRDRTKHQVAEVTSLGLVQMTRKRVGQGLVEAFSETCQHCNGRGFIVHSEPIDARPAPEVETSRAPSLAEPAGESKRSRRKKAPTVAPVTVPVLPEAREAVKATLATIAAAAAHAHEHDHDHDHDVAHEPAPEAAHEPTHEVGDELTHEVAPEPAQDEHAQPETAQDGVAPAAELADTVASIVASEGDGDASDAFQALSDQAAETPVEETFVGDPSPEQ
ncbi:MAG TPA: Rne/Rng family ribonuclease [Actinotalea sp.]